MRQLKATILLLLFVTTFGRCFAEQYGAIGDSELACCSAHSECHDDEEPAHHDEEPAPECPVCQIIDHSGFVTSAHADLDAPTFTSTSSLFTIDEWPFCPTTLLTGFSESMAPDIPDPPERQSLTLTKLVLCSAPVRGPAKA